jgi:uncharacterized protein (DUF1501 family)
MHAGGVAGNRGNPRLPILLRQQTDNKYEESLAKVTRVTHTASASPEPTRLVVVQLSGGNDYLNTVVPYADGRYYDFRPHVALRDDAILPIDERVGFSSALAPIARLYEQGR